MLSLSISQFDPKPSLCRDGMRMEMILPGSTRLHTHFLYCWRGFWTPEIPDQGLSRLW